MMDNFAIFDKFLFFMFEGSGLTLLKLGNFDNIQGTPATEPTAKQHHSRQIWSAGHK